MLIHLCRTWTSVLQFDNRSPTSLPNMNVCHNFPIRTLDTLCMCPTAAIIYKPQDRRRSCIVCVHGPASQTTRGHCVFNNAPGKLP